jgi:hypothetical protein
VPRHVPRIPAHAGDAIVDRAVQLGGKAVVPPYDAPAGIREAILANPQGAAFSASKLAAGA